MSVLAFSVAFCIYCISIHAIARLLGIREYLRKCRIIPVKHFGTQLPGIQIRSNAASLTIHQPKTPHDNGVNGLSCLSVTGTSFSIRSIKDDLTYLPLSVCWLICKKFCLNPIDLPIKFAQYLKVQQYCLHEGYC